MQYPDWSRFLLESQSFETYEPGILIDSSFKGSLSLPQQAELELRENVGADLDRTEEELLKEASFHHCFPVMRGLTHDKVQEYASHPNSLIVDIGTGWGWHWIEVAKNNPDKKFLLIDFSLNNLLICRKLMPFSQFPNVLCLQADATHLPLTAGISQLTWSVQVLQHLPPEKLNSALREIRRIAAHNSSAYLVWLNTPQLIRFAYFLKKKQYHVRGQSPQFWLDRFNGDTLKMLKQNFNNVSVDFSEIVFQPELGFRPTKNKYYKIDRILSKFPGARLIGRQAAAIVRVE